MSSRAGQMSKGGNNNLMQIDPNRIANETSDSYVASSMVHKGSDQKVKKKEGMASISPNEN